MLIAASICPKVKADGYKIAFMAKKGRADCVRHDPNIDHLIEIPDNFSPADWGAFYDQQCLFYDRMIILSDSIETTLVARSESSIYRWEPVALRAMCSDVSYIERANALVGARGEPIVPRFYETEAEVRVLGEYVDVMRQKRPVIVGIQLSGSAMDKAYPHWAAVINGLAARGDTSVMVFAENTPNDIEFLNYSLATVDRGAREIVRNSSNKDLRWAMSFAQHCDVVIGPDTGMMWGVAGNELVHKVVLLGHATPKNITHRWPNTTTLHADPLKIGCWPCHKLHGDLTHCTPDPSGKWSACVSSIRPEQVVEAVHSALKRDS